MISKAGVIEACREILIEKRKRLNIEIDEVRNSAASETKSSAGDKYETGREMMLAEAERLSKQLNEIERLLAFLYQAEHTSANSSVAFGSLIKTDKAIYFLAAAVGKVMLHERHIFVISTASPIGQALIGKKVGDQITLNGRTEEIESIIG